VKNRIKYILQKGLGFERYLYLFSHFKIRTLKKDKNEGDFFHFLDLLKEGQGNILDIGANIGIMTYYLATRFPNSTIHSLEPVPVNFGVLKRIVDKNKLKNVQLYPIALGQRPGTLKMILPYNGKTRMQGLSHVKHESISEWNEGEEFDVPVKTLDELFLGEKIQGIKIDIENFEYFAFLGGLELLKENSPVVYAELWDNDNRTNCFDLLISIGYSVYVIENNQLVTFDKNKHITQNFIFKKD
jgi:FkbM family methyltransferase